jgi:hypothetical protein
MQQGQGLARYHPGERQRRRPTLLGTPRLTLLTIRAFIIDIAFSIYIYRLMILDSRYEY